MANNTIRVYGIMLPNDWKSHFHYFILWWKWSWYGKKEECVSV